MLTFKHQVKTTLIVNPNPATKHLLKLQLNSRKLWNIFVNVLGMGVPRLACLRPAAWLEEGPSTTHLHQHRPKTLARGQASRGGRHGASSGTASSGWLARRRRDLGGVPHEVPVPQAMKTKGARQAPAHAVS